MRRSKWREVLIAGVLTASPVPAGIAVHKVRAEEATEAGPPANWQLVADDEGIKVWSLAIPGRDLPGFRGITQVNATVDEVMKFVLDVSRHTEWQYNCDESRLVKSYDDSADKQNPTHGILYNRINAPWPVHDRDVLLDINYRYTPQRTAVTFRFRDTTAFKMPVPRRVVRIPHLEGFFRIWQESPTKTNILYQVEVDIGGDVPDRLARRYAKNLPFETLEKLRDLIEEENHRS